MSRIQELDELIKQDKAKLDEAYRMLDAVKEDVHRAAVALQAHRLELSEALDAIDAEAAARGN